jgi:hypothetical protein
MSPGSFEVRLMDLALSGSSVLATNRLRCFGAGSVIMADLPLRFDVHAIHAGLPLRSSWPNTVGGSN